MTDNPFARTVDRLPRELIEAALAVALGYAVALIAASMSGVAALATALALLVAITAFVEPRLAFLAIVPSIALSPELGVAGLPVRPHDLLLVPVIAAWLLRLATRRTRLPRTSLTAPILALLAVELVATLLGALRGTTSVGLTVYSGTFLWLKSLEVFLLFFIAADSFRTAADVRRAAYLLALAGAALAFQGMLRHIAAGNPTAPVLDPEGARSYSLIATALISVASLVLALLALSPEQRRRLIWLALLVPIGYSLAFSFSRQAYAGMATALLFLAYVRRREFIPLFMVLFVGAAFLAPQPVVERATTIFDPVVGPEGDQAVFSGGGVYATRLNAWRHRLPEALRTNPITGLGDAALPPGFLDSQYLAQIYYTGLLGLGLFLWLLWRTWRTGWRLYRSEEAEPALRAVGLALAAATLGLSVTGLAGVSFIAVRSREMFWLLAALAAAGERVARIHTQDYPTDHSCAAC